MKKSLLIITFSIICCICFGQVSLQDTSGTTLSNGDTLVVNGLVGTQLSDRFYIYNTFSASDQVFCAPTSVMVKASYSICVGTLCYMAYGDSVNFLCGKFTAPSGRDSNALYTDYNPFSAGTTIIRYDVRNSVTKDSAWIFVKFIASPTGIPTISANNLDISSLYPNPANSMVNFTYHTDYDAQLSMYNSLGQLVKTIPLSSSKENVGINTSELQSGLYICKLSAIGAEPVFRRLIVSH